MPRPLVTTIDKFVKQPSEIDLLVDDIAECHRRVQKAAGQALEYAIEAGELLADIKRRTSYGQWDEWLTANSARLGLTPSTARIYMRLATYRKEIEATDIDSIRRAMEHISGRPNQTGLEAKKLQAQTIRNLYPNAPLRKIASELDVSISTVALWLNEEMRERARARSYTHQKPRKTITCPHCRGQLHNDGTPAPSPTEGTSDD
jgi:hypothetical protein